MNFKSIIKNKWVLGVLFFAVYALLINWKFAIILMVSLGFHESGHVWAMKRQGIKTSGFYFIPFIGGFAVAQENYKSYAQQAYIAIMGPIWGAGLALLTLVVGLVTNNGFYTAIACWMAILNLFNLLPVAMLDGGQTLKTIVLSINKLKGYTVLNVISIITGVISFILIKSIIIPIITYFSVSQTNNEKKYMLLTYGMELPKKLNNHQMVYTIVSYFATLIVLLGILFAGLIYTKVLTGQYFSFAALLK